MNQIKTIPTRVFPQTGDMPAPLTIHPSVSPLAAELLMKTAEILAQTPERYHQQTPIAYYCGIACCICGHMTLLNTGRYKESTNPGNTGLTLDQFRRFFHSSDWPIHAGPSSAVTPTQGIARIEHFLRTGE